MFDLDKSGSIAVMVIFLLIGVLLGLLYGEWFYNDDAKVFKSYQESKTLCEKELPRNEYCDMIVLPENVIKQLEQS